MAQRNNQDEIQLRIRAAVDGLQDIGALLNELDTLGDDTSAASDEVGQLTTTLTDLADQRRLVSALEQTRARVDESRQAMQSAQGEAERLRQAYEQSAEGVDAQRRAATEAAQQADAAKTAYQEQQRALQALQTQYKGVQEATSGARQAWRDAAQRVTDLETAIAATGTATEEQARQLEQARGASDQARRTYEEQAQSLAGLRDELTGQRRTVDDAKKAWEDYRGESRTLNTELTASERALQRQGREVEKASTAADKARGAYDRQAGTLRELGEDATAAGLDINNLSREQERLDRQSRESGDEVQRMADRLREKRRELRENTTEVERNAGALERGASSIGRWIKAAAGAAAVYLGVRQLARGLRSLIESVIGTGDRFEQLELQMRAFYDTAEEAQDALKWIRQFTRDTPLQVDGVTEAFTRLKAFGLDPMDGILQTLVDQNAKLAGGQQELLGLIDAVGKAWATGRLQMDSINQLIERGVPVWQLLQEQLGKTADEIRQMASAGQLGRGVMQQLFDAIAEDAAGSAAEQMQTFSGIVSNLRDTLEDFFNRIAKSNALDAFKNRLDQLGDTLERMEESGELDQWAEQIGAALTALIDTAGRWGNAFISNRDKVVDAVNSMARPIEYTRNAIVGAFNTIGAGVSAAMAIAVGAVAGFVSAAEGAVRVMNRFGLASDETVAKVSEAASQLRQRTAELAQASVDYGTKAAQGYGRALRAIVETQDELIKTGEAQEGYDNKLSDTLDLLSESEAAEARRAWRMGELQKEIAATEAELERYQQKLRDDPSSEYAQKVGELQNRLRYLKGELREVSQEAGAMAEGLDDAAKALGLTLDELRTGVSDSARAAIDGFEALARSGELTSDQLQVAFDEAWQRMDSPEAREAFKKSLREMADAGVEGAAQMLRAWQEAWDGLGKGAEDAANRTAKALSEIQQANQAAAESTRKEIGALRDEIGAVGEATNNAIVSWQAWAEFAKNNPVAPDIAAGIKAWREEQLAAGIATDEHTAAILRQREEMERTRQEAEQLTQSLEQQVARMREQIAQLSGDQDEVARLRYERERLQLEEQLQQARALGDAEAISAARELLRLQDQAYQLQQQQTQERERPSAGGSQQAAGPAQVAQPTKAVRITLATPTGTANLTADSDRDEQLLIDALGRDARRTTH